MGHTRVRIEATITNKFMYTIRVSTEWLSRNKIVGVGCGIRAAVRRSAHNNWTIRYNLYFIYKFSLYSKHAHSF